MKEHPIIFTGEMVRAILAVRKTETRRVVRPQPPPCQTGPDAMYAFGKGWRFSGVVYDGDAVEVCPYGVPGDRLWVRETWGIHKDIEPVYDAGGKVGKGFLAYRAGSGDDLMDGCPTTLIKRWRPSIHMPKWAARLWLEVVEVRVERVQSMSNYSWVADFCPTLGDQQRALESFVGEQFQKEHSKKLWDRLNAKRGFGWDANPWVWVIRFAMPGWPLPAKANADA